MSITISVPEKPILKPKIVVFGVGGGGCNAVNNMIHSALEGVDFVVANTDAQSLAQNDAERCIQMGAKRTQGLGAGSHPEIGFEAAEEVIGDISDAIHGAHMVFVTAGMGGGTGTGAAPVVARLAKEMGALTVGVVTKPFMFEGNRRMAVADSGIEEMQKYVDTLLIIPNQNLFRVASEQTALTEAFAMADRVLFSAVAGITNLMVRPGMINLDFADVRTVMGEMGKAMIGTGEAEGEKRGVEAAEHALNNPLLDDVSMKGARGVLISISGDENMKLYEVEEAANRIRSEVDPDAQIIFGATTDSSLGQMLRISVVATGIDQQESPPLSEMVSEMVSEMDSLNDEDDPPHDDFHDERKENIKIVGGSGEGAAAEASPMEIKPEEARPRPFQIVPPVGGAQTPPTQPLASPAQNAEAGLTAIAEEQEQPQAAINDIAAPPPPPHSAEMASPLLAKENEVAHGVHPFGSLPASTAPVAASAAPRTARPMAHSAPEYEAPKGWFGRLKARLLEASEPSPRAIPQSAHSASAPPPPPPPKSKTDENFAENIADDDQLEIPHFLKSQAR